MSRLNYCLTTGIFNTKSGGGPLAIGAVSGAINLKGYRMIKIRSKSYAAHRLAWLIVYGDLPEFVDHKDGNRTNNAISNLRPATRSQNGANCGPRQRNKYGLKGVSRHPNGKWLAQIQVNKRKLHLGLFDTAELASQAYLRSATRGFGEFARTSHEESSTSSSGA